MGLLWPYALDNATWPLLGSSPPRVDRSSAVSQGILGRSSILPCFDLAISWPYLLFAVTPVAEDYLRACLRQQLLYVPAICNSLA